MIFFFFFKCTLSCYQTFQHPEKGPGCEDDGEGRAEDEGNGRCAGPRRPEAGEWGTEGPGVLGGRGPHVPGKTQERHTPMPP